MIERVRVVNEISQLITAGGATLADPKLKTELNKAAGTGGGVNAGITVADDDA